MYKIYAWLFYFFYLVRLMKEKNNFLNELKQQRETITKQDQEIVDHIFQTCLNHVKFLNINGNNECIYEVPFMVIGYPLYDIIEITRKISKKLKKTGLTVVYLQHNKIYISWK